MSIVNVYASIEQLCLATADLFVDKARQAVQSRGRCNIVLAGGDPSTRI